MRGYLSPLLVSISLVVINEAAPSKTPVQDVLRNKRSFVTDSVHKYHQGTSGYKKLQKSPSHGQHKRGGFDTLDLDALFEDPIFAEMMAEEETGLSDTKDNRLSFDFPEFEPEPVYPNHPVQPARQPFHPIHPFHAAPRPNHLPRPHHKDEMSNVIPGALGPMDDVPHGGRVQELTGQMLDDFLWFLELKDAGFNRCDFKKRQASLTVAWRLDAGDSHTVPWDTHRLSPDIRFHRPQSMSFN